MAVLAGLARKINEEHAAAQDAQRESLDHAIAAGERLTEAKDVVAHGQWLPWIKENCLFAERTVQLYMRLAKHADDLRSKSATVADLSLNEAARLVQGEPREKKTPALGPWPDLSDEEQAQRYGMLALWHSMSDEDKLAFTMIFINRRKDGRPISHFYSNISKGEAEQARNDAKVMWDEGWRPGAGLPVPARYQ